MRSQLRPHLSLPIRVAHMVNRILTWGMTEEERLETLAEGLADWEAMATDRESWHILWRATRGVPAVIWLRLSDHGLTTMPAGFALMAVGAGGIAAGSQANAYPLAFRQSTILASIALWLVGINFMRSPNRLVVRRYRLAGVLAAAGFAGLAATMPTPDEWRYDGPVVEHALMDSAMQASFVLMAVGFLLLVVASFRSAKSNLGLAGGVTLVIGIATLGAAQIAWALGMAPVDLTTSASSVVIGLAALSLAHVLPRLRHIEIVYPNRKKPT